MKGWGSPQRPQPLACWRIRCWDAVQPFPLSHIYPRASFRRGYMPEIQLTINGQTVRVREGSSVATAIALAQITSYRRSVRGEARAPLCGMGICFECRVTINGQAHSLSYQTLCVEGMEVVTA